MSATRKPNPAGCTASEVHFGPSPCTHDTPHSSIDISPVFEHHCRVAQFRQSDEVPVLLSH